MKKIKSRFTEEESIQIYEEVTNVSIPYDYRTKDYPFEVLIGKFGDKDDEKATLYVPDYQRNFIWNKKRQSRFIESVFLGMPLTPCLLSEGDDRRLEIIDGSQRIRTLISFYNNKLALTRLKKLKSLEKAKFKDLPPKLQRQLLLRDFRMIVVSEKADENIRADIFDRVNTSSEKLTDAEVRRGTMRGAFQDLIDELSKNANFKDICPLSKTKGSRREDEELILRFFTYIDSYLEFQHDVSPFLDHYLKTMNTEEFDKDIYIDYFTKMVDFVKENFDFGFRKEARNKSVPRVRFEAIAVGSHLALEENNELHPKNMDWLNSKEFKEKTTSDSSNNPGRLADRVEFVRDCLLNKITKEELHYD